MRALELTASIADHPNRVLADVVEEYARDFGETPALISEKESFTYAELAARANQYSRWALEQGLGKNDVVCLLMPNCPEYIAVWLGITRVGVVVALLNTNLTGSALGHCINEVEASHVIAPEGLVARLDAARPHLRRTAGIWTPESIQAGSHSRTTVRPDESGMVTIEDRALCIYTSGTTGLPKAANISHGRIMHWARWFQGMIGVQSSDRMFNCLPMYHSVGGLVAPGAMLAAGASTVIAGKFSAQQYWGEIVRWRCTLLQYVGELCRYLVDQPPSAEESRHEIRMACGNGLAADVWERFQERFRIPRIFEFYAATEGGVSLFNIEGVPGSVGHVPPYLRHRFSPALVRFDSEREEPVRNKDGFCIRCAQGETGEAIGKAYSGGRDFGSRFEGYTNRQAAKDKILKNVFETGDLWVRTGDLMRQDERGFFYFVERTGDTFRWKGENVSTAEVARAIREYPGVRHVAVYGVSVPFADGRAGMAALVTDPAFDLKLFREHLAGRLPSYACPVFLRISETIEITDTFKYQKTQLVGAGYNPAGTTDRFYLNDRGLQAFVRVDNELYERLRSGTVRL